MKTRIEIRSIGGRALFSHEEENNSVKRTLEAAVKSGADLRGAYLSGANLSGANLYGEDLSGADLRFANLSGANLSDANLLFADLRFANLSGADLSGATYDKTSLWYSQSRILPDDGDITGYKKCRNGVIVKLLIKDGTPRGHAFGRKCRAQGAEVLEVIGAETGLSQHDPNFKYEAGKTVSVDNFDPDFDNECAPGIHFFITKAEAENYW